MKRVRYTKYNGDLGSEMDMEELLQALSDYLLDSGFRDGFTRFQQLDHNLDDLREALRRVLEEGDAFDQTTRRQLDQMAADGTLDELIEKLLDRMERENYISSSSRQDRSEEHTPELQSLRHFLCRLLL